MLADETNTSRGVASKDTTMATKSRQGEFSVSASHELGVAAVIVFFGDPREFRLQPLPVKLDNECRGESDREQHLKAIASAVPGSRYAWPVLGYRAVIDAQLRTIRTFLISFGEVNRTIGRLLPVLQHPASS